MLYWLVTAMHPQFLITLDEELSEKAVTVRVGQAVNTVGLAGTRMGISGVSISASDLRQYPLLPLQMDVMKSLTFSSKRIKRPCALVLASARNWVQTSSSLTSLCWRDWLF